MEYYGDTLGDVISKSLHRELSKRGKTSPQLQHKTMITIPAPPLRWGAWINIHNQFGVVGANSDQHVTNLDIAFTPTSEMQSSFGIQIQGGDEFIDTFSTGSTTVRATITGNVMTVISVRCKSFSPLTPLSIRVSITNRAVF